jgi:hypothetical protein
VFLVQDRLSNSRFPYTGVGTISYQHVSIMTCFFPKRNQPLQVQRRPRLDGFTFFRLRVRALDPAFFDRILFEPACFETARFDTGRDGEGFFAAAAVSETKVIANRTANTRFITFSFFAPERLVTRVTPVTNRTRSQSDWRRPAPDNWPPRQGDSRYLNPVGSPPITSVGTTYAFRSP